MVFQILATKLFVPPVPLKEILRPRLIEKLNEGLHSKLTLISAPAGFGKTTVVSQWIASLESKQPTLRAAWLSLDGWESNPISFLTYLVAALRTTAPDFGSGVFSALQSTQPPPIEYLLTALLNEITNVPVDLLVVLDDYHLIDHGPVDGVNSADSSGTVDGALTFLLDHLPSKMHLVITTREDPALPIPRLRARGQLVEIRAADLRFTHSETAEFLKQVMDVNLSVEEIATLETRTEGWIAGVQLAALSMKNNQDVSGFIQAFAGDHRYIVDYLMEEVLRRQSECVRNFLLHTSILERLNGPLCDAVTDQVECHVLLETLERGNYFIVPLDDKRHWFRYHHLFADVLCMHLTAEQPDQVAILHRRASEWYEHNGYAVDAIGHALAGQDFERAANLIELAFTAMTRSRQEGILLGWLKALPEAVVCDRPVLCNLYAGALMQTGELEGVETWLTAAERCLTPARDGHGQPVILPPGMVVVDQEELRRLPGAVAMHRAGQALMLGKVEQTILHARRVLDLAPQDDFLRRGGAAALLGLAFWTLGDLEAARRIYPEGILYLQRAGFLSDSIGCALALADIVIAQGHLHEAMGIYEQALRLASEHGEPNLRGTADMLVGMSEMYYEQNDLQAAAECLLRAKEQGEHTGLPQNRYRLRVAMARVREAEGDPKGALGLLDEAERLFMGDFSPNVRPISALKARMWVEQGRLVEALDWAHERNLSVEDDLSYLREYEHITLARMLLTQYKRDGLDSSIREAIGLLESLLKAAEAGGRMSSVIEILVLRALAHQAIKDIPAALLALQRALTLAEPEGYIRMFVDEGVSMADLLREAAAHRIAPEYSGKLLAAFGGEQPGDAGVPRSSTAQSHIETLSQRELEVLRLFKTELSGPEIAEELVVALSTVRTHTKNIYSKLDVNSRRAAVKRAIELGLI